MTPPTPPPRPPALPQIVVVNLLPTVLIGLLAVLIWRWIGVLRDPLLLLTLSALLAAALNPLVVALRQYLRLPRALGAVLSVLLVLSLVYISGALLFPTISSQLENFARNLPTLTRTLENTLDELVKSQPLLKPLSSQNLLTDLGSRLLSAGNEILSRSTALLRDAARVLAALVFLVALIVYMLAHPEPLVRGGLALVPGAYRARVGRIAARVLRELGGWGRAQLLLMLTMGVLTWLTYTALGVPNTLLYGFIAALGEAIPTVGPIVAALPPLLAVLADSPDKVLWLVLATVGIHQLENHLLVPLLLGRGVRLHPVSVMAGILVCSTAAGLLGAFLAVPLLIVIKTLYEGWREEWASPDDLTHEAEFVQVAFSQASVAEEGRTLQGQTLEPERDPPPKP